MNRQRIIANLLIMGTGQMATWLLSTLTLVLAGRYFGPARLGELALAGSTVAVFGLVVKLGMDTLISRTAARTPERMGALISAALLVRLLLAFPALCILVAYVSAAALSTETRLVIYIMASGAILGSLSGVLVAAFQGYEKMSLSALGQTLGNLADLGVAVLVVALHGSIVLFASLGVPVEFLLLLLNLHWLRRYAQLTPHLSPRDLRSVALGSLPFWANSVFLTIYIAIDSIMLASLAGTRAVGIYAPATRMFSVGLFLPAIIGQVTLPLLSRRGVDAGTDFQRAGRETLSLLVACAVPLTIGLATFAGPLVAVVYGSAYQASAGVLVVLSLCLVPTFLNIQAAQTLAACDRQSRWTVAMAASCVINPLINYWLIPYAARHWQNAALGSALALLITEVLMAGYAAAVLHRMIVTKAFGRVFLASLLAGGVQLVVVWALTPLWIPFAEALGLAGYVAVALALGALPRAEVAALRRAVQARVRRAPAPRVGEVSP